MKSWKSCGHLADLRPGDHPCFLYETEEEHRAVLTPFLRQGLEHGDKVIYLLDHHAPETIFQYLEDEGMDLEPFLRRGQLVFRSARETYLSQGKFEPDATIDLWQREVEQSLAEGYRSLRVTGEMTWAAEQVPGPELIAYEIKLNEFPQAENFLALCQYNRPRFDPIFLMDVFAAHEKAVIGTEVVDNIYYLPSKGLSDPERAAAKFDEWLNTLAERKRTMEAREQEFRRVNQHLWCEIEKRGQMEDRLRESEARFVAFMQHLPGAAVIRDLEGHYLFANEGWEKAFGKEKADWQGKTLEEVWPAEMASYVREQDQQVISTRQPTETVVFFELEDDRQAWLINRFPILDEKGQPIMVGAAGIDITARFTAEKTLYRKKEQYQNLAEKSPLGISIISKDGRYSYLNPKFVEIFGYTLEDIPTGRDWFARAFPDPVYRRQALTAWINDLKHCPPGELQPRTFTVTCKDGSQKVINFSPVSLEGGNQIIIYEDITERLQTDEAIRESERRFRQLVEHAADAFFLHDRGKIIEVNQQACLTLGYTREELLNMSISDFEEGINPQELNNLWEQEMEAPVTLLGTHRRKDGSTFPVEIKVGSFDYKGQRLRLALARDITARVQAEEELRKSEEALRKSEAEYRLLVNQIPAAVFRGYADWSISCFDRKIEAITGYAKEEFDSRRVKWSDLIPEEEMDYVRNCFIEGLRTDKSYEREHRIKKKGGGYAWVHCRGQIFCDPEGNVEYVSGVTFDVTKHKQAEAALRESEKRYRLLAENVSDVIWTADLNLRLTYISPSVMFFRGFTPEEVLGQRMEEIITPDSLELARKTFAEGMALEKRSPDPGRSWILELEHLCKDGSTVWAEVRASFLRDDSGRPVGILGITRDISKRKEAEDALRRREAVLEAVSFAAAKFLQATSWEEDIQEIMEYLGKAIQSSRVFIFENRSSDGVWLTSQRHEWVAPGITPEMNNPELQNLPLQAAGYGRWEETLRQGGLIFGHVRGFPSCEQELLAAQDIKSLVVVPIFADQEWWGFIGFGECHREREWSACEIEALKAAASTLGAAIQDERAEKALRESQKKLRSLTNQLLSAQENERKRLAAELHDELGHSLLTLKLRLKALEKQMAPQQKSLKRDLKHILQDVGTTLEDVRRLYLDLSPGDLEDLGLTGALRAMIEDLTEVKPGITWSVKLDNLDGLFPAPLQTAIYRIVQEALTNIGKHAKAKHITLVAARENHRVSFNVEDDGQGFDRDEVLATKKTLGLLAMEERVRILSGSFELWSRKKQGTRISFSIPIPEERD